jgi:hypothetical protein
LSLPCEAFTEFFLILETKNRAAGRFEHKLRKKEFLHREPLQALANEFVLINFDEKPTLHYTSRFEVENSNVGYK